MGRFDALTDVEFEDFVAELQSAVTGLKFVAGTRGKDRGIDALSVVDGKRHVIQCKHYVRSDFSALKRSARKEVGGLEAWKEPLASYRFVTSMELSHAQRDELTNILEPWIGSRDHVLGGKELIADLREDSTVEIHHPKLWFDGAGQLRRQLSAEQYARRAALMDEIRPRLPRFVETEAFRRARRLLRDGRVCIIDGSPGVGKTTLAQLLLIDSLENAFEPFEIVRGGLSKAWELLELEEKQVFYFDDFLGRVQLFEARDEDQDLVRFIRAIARDERRRLILTTRDYIFTEARRKSEELYREVDDATIVVLASEQYSRMDRARILYNHLRFSPRLDERMRASLVYEDHYQKIIDHVNFSPRLIEWITGFAGNRLRVNEGQGYGRYCLAVLETPGNLWATPFGELDEHQKAVLFALVGLPEQVKAKPLEAAFTAACASRGLSGDKAQFAAAVSALDGSFLSGWKLSRFKTCSLLNPSLLDFLEREAITSRTETEALLRGACFYEQVVWLWDACRKDSELPPEHLWPAFDEAFARLFDASPAIDARVFPFHLSGPDDDSFPKQAMRLDDALRRCENPWFRESSATWLSTPALRWLREVGEDGTVYRHKVETIERLIEHGILDGKVVFEVVRPKLAALEPGVDRWRLLDSLRRLSPAAVSDSEVFEWKEGLRTFVGCALENPGSHLAGYRDEELDSLLEVTKSWGIQLDGNEVESARWGLWEIQEEEDRFSEMIKDGKMERTEAAAQLVDEPPEKEASSDEDSEIEAMFGRFGREYEELLAGKDDSWDDE